MWRDFFCPDFPEEITACIFVTLSIETEYSPETPEQAF
jgi:hypothetical protein